MAGGPEILCRSLKTCLNTREAPVAVSTSRKKLSPCQFSRDFPILEGLDGGGGVPNPMSNFKNGPRKMSLSPVTNQK